VDSEYSQTLIRLLPWVDKADAKVATLIARSNEQVRMRSRLNSQAKAMKTWLPDRPDHLSLPMQQDQWPERISNNLQSKRKYSQLLLSQLDSRLLTPQQELSVERLNHLPLLLELMNSQTWLTRGRSQVTILRESLIIKLFLNELTERVQFNCCATY